MQNRTGKERLTWRGSGWRRSGGRRLVAAHEGRPCSLFTVEPGLPAVIAASFRRDCRQNGKWWPAGWSIFLLCFSCCWKGRMASADSATAVEERCGFYWFNHCGWGRIWLRRRLQLGEWLNSFLVVVGAGHGSTEVVLLAAGIFRGKPVCCSGVSSLLLSVEGLRKRKRDLAVASGFEWYQAGLSWGRKKDERLLLCREREGRVYDWKEKGGFCQGLSSFCPFIWNVGVFGSSGKGLDLGLLLCVFFSLCFHSLLFFLLPPSLCKRGLYSLTCSFI